MQEETFKNYVLKLNEFKEHFDPTEYLNGLAGDSQMRQIIKDMHNETDDSLYVQKLWNKLGFSFDPQISDFMLFELILRYSDSLEVLNLSCMRNLILGEEA